MRNCENHQISENYQNHINKTNVKSNIHLRTKIQFSFKLDKLTEIDPILTVTYNSIFHTFNDIQIIFLTNLIKKRLFQKL